MNDAEFGEPGRRLLYEFGGTGHEVVGVVDEGEVLLPQDVDFPFDVVVDAFFVRVAGLREEDAELAVGEARDDVAKGRFKGGSARCQSSNRAPSRCGRGFRSRARPPS